MCRKEVRWKDLGVDGSIMLKMDVRETNYEGMPWTQVTQVKLQWSNITNLVKNFEGLEIQGIS
jgi:hypothetical protein